MNETKSWGWELIVDCGGCNRQAIGSYSTIFDFVEKLVVEIDMIAYGEPKIVHFGEGNKAGYTLLQLIETSNITAHFVEESENAFINIFSCKEFDADVALKVIDKYFQPTKIRKMFIDRNLQ